MDNNMIGTRIRAFRLQRDITQSKLGSDLSVSASTISNWEKGRRYPSISELRRVSDYFNVPLSSLANEDNERSNGLGKCNQIISHRPLGLSLGPGYDFVLLTSAMSIMGVFLLDSPIRYVMLGLGIVLILVLHAVYVKGLTRNRHLNHKRQFIPSSLKVSFINAQDPVKIVTLSKRLLAGSYLAMVASLLSTASVIHIACREHLLSATIALTVLALVSVMSYYEIQRTIKSNKLFAKEISYHETYKDVRYPAFLNAFIAQSLLSVLSILVLLISLDVDVVFGLGSISMLLSLIALGCSYKILFTTSDFTTGFTIHAKSEDGDIHMIL